MNSAKSLLAYCLFFWTLQASAQRADASEFKLNDFIAQTKTAPIIFPKEAITTAQFSKQQAEWAVRIFLPVIVAGVEGREDREALLAILKETVEWWGASSYGSGEHLSFQDSELANWRQSRKSADALAFRSLGERLRKALPVDAKLPTAQFFASELFVFIADIEGTKRRSIAASKEKSEGPAAFITALAMLKPGPRADRNAVFGTASELLVNSLSSAWITESDAQFVLDILIRRSDYLDEKRYAELAAAVRSSKFIGWAKDTLEAHWTLRSVMPGGSAAPLRNAAFQHARKLLVSAWRTSPKRPEAPALMVLVAAFDPEGDDEVRLWFDRAVSLQCDYPAAYEYMFDALRNGADSGVLAFGLACSKCERTDIEIQEYLILGILDMVKKMPDWRPILRHPEIQKKVSSFFKQRIDSALTEELHQHFCATAVLLCWMVGDFQESALRLSSLEGGLTDSFRWPSSLELLAINFQLDLRRIVSESLDLGFHLHTEVSRANQALENGEFEVAEKITAELLAGPQPEYWGAWVKGLNVNSTFQKTFHRGQWSAVPVHFGCWFRGPGVTSRPGGKTFEFATYQTVPLRRYFRPELGDRYEVRGQFRPPKDGTKAGLIFILGRPPEFHASNNGYSLEFRLFANGDGTSHTQLAIGMSWSEQDRQAGPPVEDVIKFRFLRNREKVSWWVNDKQILDGQALPDGIQSGAYGFGIGGTTHGGEERLRIENIEMRKLGDEF